MYCGISESSSSSAVVYGSLPLPPGTSSSWMPPSSLYCCQRSVSRISRAARNLRIAASPLLKRRLGSSVTWLNTSLLSSSRPTAAEAADAMPVLRIERRVVCLFVCLCVVTICLLPHQRRVLRQELLSRL